MARHTRKTLTPQAVGYIRVSTEDQSVSVEAQRARLESWCAARHLVLVAVHADIGVSGGTALDKRLGLMAALDALTPGMALVAVKRDRLARDTMHAAMIERLAERAGAYVLTCDGAGEGDSPEAQMLRGIMDVFAQYERAVIRARTKAALAHKRANGERTSLHAPYGFQIAVDGKTLVRDEAEQALLDAIREARQRGLSQRAVVAELTRQGFTTRKGTALSLMQVQRIMSQAHIA